MIVIPLQSGSTGNCVFVRAKNTSLLFDAGISGKCAEQRLLAVGQRIDDVAALIISHEHSDHVRSAGVFARKYNIPIYITPQTYARIKHRYKMDGISGIHFFNAGDTLEIGDIKVMTIATPHDAVDGSCFVVKDQCFQVGIFTDLGHVFPALQDITSKLDGIYIESNYDPAMLRTGPYPNHLKRRISGPAGHISNKDSAGLISNYGSTRLQWICLAHLSEENNTAEKALAAHQKLLGDEFPIGVASRSESGPIFKATNELFNSDPISYIKTPASTPVLAIEQGSLFE